MAAELGPAVSKFERLALKAESLRFVYLFVQVKPRRKPGVEWGEAAQNQASRQK